MQKRQLIIIASALLILATGFGGFKLLASLKKAPERKAPIKSYRLVNTLVVHNDTLVQRTPIQGKLVAQEKIEVFPEVTGRLLPQPKPFKVGQSFWKGEVMLAIDGSESLLNLNAQRSSFIALLTQVLADIQIDYPSE